MAGAGRKTLGAVGLMLGIILFIAGIGAVAFATVDEQQNEKDHDPLPPDEDRSDANGMILAAGIAAGVLGLLGIVLGAISISSGANASHRQRQEELVLAMAGQDKAKEVAEPSVTTSSRTEDLRDDAYTSGERPAWIVPVVAVGALVLLVAVAAILLSDADDGGILAGLTGQPQLLSEQSYNAEIPASFTILGSSNSASAAPTTAFDLPAGTVRFHVVINWDPVANGVDAMDFLVEQDVAGAGFTERGQASGGPGLELDVEGFALGEWRFSATPAADGFNADQPYTVTITAYSD